MSRKIKATIAILAAILLLTMGGAAVAFAATPEKAPPANGSQPILTRVAEILGVTTDNLTAAYKQARQEILPQPPKPTTAARPQTDNSTRPELKAQLRDRVKDAKEAVKEKAQKALANKARVEVKKEIREQVQEKARLAAQDLAGREKKIMARVAELLGIPLERLEAAFQQAREEMKIQGFEKLLDKAVAKSIITGTDKQAVLGWWNSRPAAVDKLLPFGGWFKK